MSDWKNEPKKEITIRLTKEALKLFEYLGGEDWLEEEARETEWDHDKVKRKYGEDYDLSVGSECKIFNVWTLKTIDTISTKKALEEYTKPKYNFDNIEVDF